MLSDYHHGMIMLLLKLSEQQNQDLPEEKMVVVMQVCRKTRPLRTIKLFGNSMLVKRLSAIQIRRIRKTD